MYIMQKVLVIVVLLLIPLHTAFAEGDRGHTVTIQVNGLSCPFCAYGLEKNLKKVAGVQSVHMNMKTGKAIVTMQDNTHVDDKVLRLAVKKAGFTARDITYP